RQLLELLVAGAFIDEHAEAPVAIGHHLGGFRDRGDLDAADVRALDLAFLDVEHEGDTAVVVGRAPVERHVARTKEVARARLDITAFQAPRHSRLLSGWCGTRFSLLGRRRVNTPSPGSRREKLSAERSSKAAPGLTSDCGSRR